MIPQEASGAHVVLLATGGIIASRSPPEGRGSRCCRAYGEQLLRSAASSLFLVRRASQGSYQLEVLGVFVTDGTDALEETSFPDLTHDDHRPVAFSGP